MKKIAKSVHIGGLSHGCVSQCSSENVNFEWFLLQKYVGVFCYLLKFIWWADRFSLHCIAVKSEKWIYPTISEKLTFT